MQVEVRNRDVADHRVDSGDRPDPNGAVAAQDENRPVILEERIGDTGRRRSHHFHDRLEILGSWPGPVGAPGNDGRIPQIADVETDAERLDESGGAEGGWGLFLAHPACAGARRRANDC